ncbi:hypothetical protein, partial [Mesorhizobium sp. M7A.F.Ca.CA.004.08.1.1]|uniref:hypothetical protein n=1 Tax=Mesorhizobium sp. M7A.F.Ca.CA.004.08.1.1 TaxID=2496730 RepID=UPI0019D2AC66
LLMRPFRMKQGRATAQTHSLCLKACHFLPRSCKNAKENYMRFSHGCQALVGAQYLMLRA